ncbi:hypothetical protein HMI01_15530 [Halolactibacillus miurensis]|uniref:Diguanylate cyclase (GGDEF) domain-containing protein n=1 Tax=Halolactibacillus miurensis TaxID=306541 RepID=A0A1I6RXD9_9BACI|nr:sensor domain-containing diguanylate cyclase [Halolactibacillus miurensis]GEM04565.1 hypothetical protein HMI01_15530 [Halolactibacillus miurensis]SFS69260.1 diguanylate cyclase (GGDEF) domain-containing protein [Halolactibacillus miurensis]
MSELIEWIVIMSIVSIALNVIRFFLNEKRNRLLVFLFFTFSFLSFQSHLLDEYYLLVVLYLMTGMYSLHANGLIISSAVVLIRHFLYFTPSVTLFGLLILTNITIYIIGTRGIHHFNQLSDWKQKMYQNTKQLTIMKEISAAIQQTDELDRLLHIIVTTITAGHGLGFNRCLVFLNDHLSNHIHGMMGIGPVRGKDGFEKWNEIAVKKYKLTDLLERMDEEHIDPELNELVSSLSFDFRPSSIFYQALRDGKDRLINVKDVNDTILNELSDYFHMDEVLIVPMVYQNKKIGILLIDNPVTHKKITPEEIDNLMPLALQTAISIHQLNMYQHIKTMSVTDGLTKLKNQRALKNDLTHIFSEKDPQFAVVMIDIDYFKHYNDTNGHLLGNVALEQLATLLKSHMRKTDQSYRFGGEEFSVILMNVTPEEAYDIADRIRLAVLAEPFPEQHTQPGGHLTISLGVSHTDFIHDLTEHAILKTSDEALYEAKKSGKNKVVLYQGGRSR